MKRLFFLFLLGLGIYLLRRPIVETVVEKLARRAFSEPLVYKSRRWEGDVLVFRDLEIGSAWKAEKAELRFACALFPFYFQPRLFIEGLQIEEGSTSDLSILSPLIPAKYFGLKLDIERGAFLFREQPSLSFTFASGIERGEIGTAAVYDEGREKQEPLIFATFSFLENYLAVDWQIDEMSLDRVGGMGVFAGSGQCIFDDSFKISSLKMEMAAQDLLIPDFFGSAVSAESLKGEVSFERSASWLGGLTGAVDVVSGSIVAFDWGFTEASGRVVLKSGQEPAATLVGRLIHQGESYPAELTLQGIAHPDNNFWVQADLNFKPKMGGCNSLTVSMCRLSPGSYVVETNIGHFSKDGLQMAIDAASLVFPAAAGAQISQIDLSGKATAWIEDGTITRIDLERAGVVDGLIDLPILDLKLFIQRGKVTGEWIEGRVISCRMGCENSAFWVKDQYGDRIQGEISIVDDMIEKGKVQGEWVGIAAAADLQGAWQSPEAHLFLRGPPSAWISLLQPVGGAIDSPYLSVEAVCHKENRILKATGTISMGRETASFGGELELSGVVRSGWLRAPAISEQSIAPFLNALQIPFQFTGVSEVLVEVSKGEVDASVRLSNVYLKMEDCILAIPELGEEDPDLLNTGGWISLKGREGSFKAIIPLKEGTLEGNGWKIDHVRGAVEWTPQKIKASCLSGNFGGLAISGEVSWTSLGEGVWEAKAASHEIRGKIPPGFEVSGDFSVSQGGVQALLTNASGQRSIFWSVRAHLSNAEMPLDTHLSLMNVDAALDYDASRGIAVLSGARGLLALGKERFPFTTEKFLFQKGEKIEFDISSSSLGSIKVSANDPLTEFSAQGTLFSAPLQLQVRKSRNWVVETFRLGALSVQGSLSQTPHGWKILNWSAQHTNYQAQGEAEIEGNVITLKQVSAQGPSGYGLKNLKPVCFDLSSQALTGLSVAILANNKTVALFESPLFRYVSGEKCWQSDQTRLCLMDSEEGNFICRLGKERSSLQGAFQSGNLKEMIVLFERPTLNIKLGGKVKEAPFQAVGRFDTRDFRGGVLVRAPGRKESLSVTCGPNLSIEKIEGAWQGMACSLEGPDQFHGTVQLLDREAAIKAVPWIPNVNGVELTGVFTKGSFKGEISGDLCSLFGKSVEKLRAACQLDETSALIQELQLIDPSGCVEIKQIRAQKMDDAWKFSIPLLKAREVRPALEKPFTIRSAVFSDIQGVLGDIHSIRGSGSLHFTNVFRKEASIFDAPVQILKDIGLDLDLFTPVLGEISCQIREGKVFLTQLKNAFSEGRRSEFFLASEPSYIDAYGNMNIHLRMRQSAVLKIGEAFGLAISGTMEKPRYRLQPAGFP